MTIRFPKTVEYLRSINMDPNTVLVHEYTNPLGYIHRFGRPDFSYAWMAWPEAFDWKTFRIAYDDDQAEAADRGVYLEEIYTDDEGRFYPRSTQRLIEGLEQSRQARTIFAGSPTDPNLEFQKIFDAAYKSTKGSFA